jgi:hypothetical protein
MIERGTGYLLATRYFQFFGIDSQPSAAAQK